MSGVISGLVSAYPGLAEVLQGGIVSLLVALVRRVSPSTWERWGTPLRVAFVALAAALWSLPTGWAVLGLRGVALAGHALGAFVAALGVRQVAKAPQRLHLERNADPRRGLSTRLPPP